MNQVENEVIDFKNISAATESTYLSPGMYRLKVDKDNISVQTPQGKTPYLSVKFINENGGGIVEKFYLTAKALARIQYLHEAWFSKSLDKAFKSYPEIGEYMKAALTSKIVTRPMVVGGKITPEGKFFSGLPYTGFVVANESDFEEGAFVKDSEQYNKVVKHEKPNPAVAGTNSPIVGDIPAGYVPVAGDNPWA